MCSTNELSCAKSTLDAFVEVFYIQLLLSTSGRKQNIKFLYAIGFYMQIYAQLYALRFILIIFNESLFPTLLPRINKAAKLLS